MPEYTFNSTSTNINYFHNDIKSEKAIFLLPGGWSSWRAWSDYLQNTDHSKQYSIYAIDPPGRGKSGDLDNFSMNNLVQPIVELIEFIDSPNSYVIGHSYAALMACEIGIKMGTKLKSILAEDPGWSFTYEDLNVKEWGNVPNILRQKPNWKNSLDAVYELNGPDKENWDKNSILWALNAYESSYNSFNLLNKESVHQDYEKICKGLNIKTYIARANPEKGGMIPDQVMDQVKDLNPLIEFHEFDTGHGIRNEKPKEYHLLINKMLNY
ncbi:MAG: alpha/beta hydrolase [SAR202 cluster bacterium]|nr:alpha/beta hydrolase [SAR202 cluster bacterium]RZP15986.1 MAG: alpha/beta hydrolase [Chloroflexota bacterium]|tara:strand:+ start:200 stop:1003 length:804 start_codon:yes stop_codon:yes gene_type:complete